MLSNIHEGYKCVSLRTLKLVSVQIHNFSTLDSWTLQKVTDQEQNLLKHSYKQPQNTEEDARNCRCRLKIQPQR